MCSCWPAVCQSWASVVRGGRIGSGWVVEDFAFVVIALAADNSGVMPGLHGGGGHAERLGHFGEGEPAGVAEPAVAAA